MIDSRLEISTMFNYLNITIFNQLITKNWLIDHDHYNIWSIKLLINWSLQKLIYWPIYSIDHQNIWSIFDLLYLGQYILHEVWWEALLWVPQGSQGGIKQVVGLILLKQGYVFSWKIIFSLDPLIKSLFPPDFRNAIHWIYALNLSIYVK